MSEDNLQRFGAGVLVRDSAIVDAGVQIGDGAKIWHFTHVLGNANICSNRSIDITPC